MLKSTQLCLVWVPRIWVPKLMGVIKNNCEKNINGLMYFNNYIVSNIVFKTNKKSDRAFTH